jgi:hypothetical protein
VFENSIGAEKSDPSDPVSDPIEFHKIRLNSDWRKFCTVKKIEKLKIGWFYQLIGPNLPKFGLIRPKFSRIVEVIEV